MKIVAQISSISHFNELKNNFIYQCLSELTKNEPECKILFITDKNFLPPQINNKNILFLPSAPVKKQLAFNFYWNTYKLPKILRDFGADFFVSTHLLNKKKIKAKKILWPDNFSNLDSSRKNYVSADLIICPNEFIAQKTEQKFQLPKEKVVVIHPGVGNEMPPVDFDQKEKIKIEYSDGADFFYVDGKTASLDTIKKILQSFSLFKKWQQSSMKMMLSADLKKRKELMEMLKNYKYRQDVICLNAGQEDKIPIFCSASYAAIFISDNISLQAEMMYAIESQTAVILPDVDFYKSSFGNSVLYTKDSLESIAENLMLLYKDETTRNILISRAGELSSGLTRKKAALEFAKRAKELI